MTLVERIEALQAQKSDSVLVGAYLPFPLGPDVTVERLAVRIGGRSLNAHEQISQEVRDDVRRID